MYKPIDKLQHSFLDFNQPMGLHMNPDNRWIKLADRIPWDEFEAKYAKLFPSDTGNVASLFDGIGCGLGFTLALTILGSAREILGAGSVFGITLLPETTNILMFILPPGAFLTLGYIIAIFNKVKK